MIGTEKEFSLKRCTIALVQLAVPDREDRAGMLAAGETRCIGAACAQWHWYDYADAEGSTYFPAGADRFHRGKATEAAASKGQVSSQRVPARGYCGLTGTRE